MQRLGILCERVFAIQLAGCACLSGWVCTRANTTPHGVYVTGRGERRARMLCKRNVFDHTNRGNQEE